VIGQVIEVHYYDGNRGPLRHIADKIEINEAEAARQKSQSWWYQKAAGGGSLLDYLGYGVTLGTWFHDGRAPIEVTCVVDEPPGLDVDEHSVTIARYDVGLSKYETRLGHLHRSVDPSAAAQVRLCRCRHAGHHRLLRLRADCARANARPGPKPTTFPWTPSRPVSQSIEYLVHVLTTGEQVTGPLSPHLSRVGQQSWTPPS
jgi:glucose-fructose oxidoreductase